MTATAQNVSPFSRFSRAFGWSNKSNGSPSRPKPQKPSVNVRENEEQWYIPYTGTYEPPKPVVRRARERDSWGDPIDGEEDDPEDHFLADPELHNRYGVRPSSSSEWKSGSGIGGGQGRTRTHSGGSVFSGRTVSSGTVDPGRGSMTVPRRSTVGSAQRPPIPSMSAPHGGGIGDSPVLPTRSTNSTSTRKSLGSLFTFNPPNKKKGSNSSLKYSPDPNRQVGMSTANSTKPAERPNSRSPLPDADKRLVSNARLPSDPNLAADALRGSAATNDEDYYDSYYSTLLNMSTNNQPHQAPQTGTSDPSDFNTRQPSHTPEPTSDASASHPYAYTFPPSPTPLDPPQSAPSMQRLHFSPTRKPREQGAASTTVSPIPRYLPQGSLKNSASTPNLRGNNQTPANQPRRNFRDRLLSAETWCDALLFPRPRLKVKRDGASGESTPSGRIVSPPSSPVIDYFGNRLAAEGGIASRVLAHSRSLVDLSSSRAAGPSMLREEEPPLPLPPPRSQRAQGKKPEDLPRLESAPERPPRPKSWALDDLVLPSPVPSLARVLEEGQILEHQRKKWQTQAINSFQNERARSLSRARSKSQRNKKRSDKANNFEYLAARGLLGNQEPIPVHPSAPRAHLAGRPRTTSETDSRGTTVPTWSSSHAHSNSLSKTLTKSSRSHSRNHSRSDSIGKSAIRMAKSTAKSTAALCGGGIVITPMEEKNRELAALNQSGGLEVAIRAPGTRVIRLQDPAQMQTPVTPLSPLDAARLSPSPSALSDSRVGIAISTPPLTDETVDRESLRLPSHPYAQGGFAVSVPHQANRGTTQTSPVSPTHTSPSMHPYALVSATPSIDSYTNEGRIVKEVRTDSLVPPPEKMWAQWGGNPVREILPSDIQYSPFVSVQHYRDEKNGERNEGYSRAMRNSSPIYDTAGIGEALAWAARRQSRDSGLGASEEQASSNFVMNEVIPEKEEAEGDRFVPIAVNERPTVQRYDSARRIPVQYDASRPAHLHHVQKASITSSLVPSPVNIDQLPQPELPHSTLPVPTRHDSARSSPSASTANSSPPLSPPILGNPDDLEHYRDLFYRPRGSSVDGTAQPLNTRSPIHQPPNIPWDVRSQGTGRTGLTSLARKFSEDHDEHHDEQLRRSISLSSRSSLSVLRQSAYATGRSPPTDTSLRFVFSEIPETASVEAVTRVKPVGGEEDTHGAFYPSGQIPEDIETSTRASSPTSPIDDETLNIYRLGNVEPSATPMAESTDPRLSFVGQMSYAHEDMRNEEDDVLGASPSFVRHPTAHSSLQPPSADPTRSSYMTSASEGSRMSVSDFPAPPPQQLTPAHMSLLSHYFDETLTPSELAQVQAEGVHSKPGTRSRAGSVSALATLGRNGGHNTPADGQTVAGDHQERTQQSLDDNNQVIDELLARLSPTT
ncbi:hypothetical protein AAF712_002584 [Marasmius tenuissimus]|uniref:Uncharacterized protein n=1 Tax=Marasmius tenuissimus TaxID=585030 RepID=A0ABR3A7Z2_9AGAR